MPEFRIVVIKNSPIGANLPLSVYLTGFLAHWQAPSGAELVAIVGDSDHIPEQISNKIKIYQIRSNLYGVIDNIRFTLRSFQILLKEHRKQPIDIIHSFYPNSSLLASVLFKIFIHPSVRIIYDVRSPWIEMIFIMKYLHQIWYWIVKSMLFLEERWLVRFVDHFIFVSNGLSAYYQTNFHLPERPISVVGSAVDHKKFTRLEIQGIRRKLGIPKDALVLGYVGMLASARKLDVFVNMFIKALDGAPDIHFVIVGDGEQRIELELLANTYGVASQIHFVGAIPHDMVPAYINSWDYGVCHYPATLAYNVSHPLKILEYLAVGIPVLASDTLAHREIASSISAVSIYEDAESLAKFLRHRPDRVDPSVVDPHIWEASAQHYKTIYRSLLGPVLP